MLEVKGDITKIELLPNEAIVATTNNVITQDGRLVMGAGIAKHIRDKYIGIDKEFGRQLKELDETDPKWAECYNFLWCNTSLEQKFDFWNSTQNTDSYIFGLQTKLHWKEKSELYLIVQSCLCMVGEVDAMKIKKIYMTRPGCGNGGLNWEDVKPAIEKILDDRFHVYYQ